MKTFITVLGLLLFSTVVYAQIELVEIQPGEFQMGNITGHPTDHSDEYPVHKVILTKGFFISKFEVTQDIWEEIMGSNPSSNKGDRYPVENVSWPEIIDFCNKLSIKEGLTPCYSGEGVNITCDFDANGYRLPTDAEWEYACRAGTTTDFYTGDQTYYDCYPLDPVLDRAAWYCGNSDDHTHEVGLKEPNTWGLYDMHGNVWEFTWDNYDKNYYQSSTMIDPRGPGGKNINKPMRGGSFANKPIYGRSSDRNTTGSLYYKGIWTGFRVLKGPCTIKYPTIESNDSVYCFGEEITFESQSGFLDYEWFIDEMSFTDSDSIFKFNNLKPGTYTVKLEALSCDSTVVSNLETITILPEPNPNLIDDTTICEGDFIELIAANGFTSYKWNNGNTDESLIVNKTGEYWIEVLDGNGCIGYDTVKVTVAPLPEFTIKTDKEEPYHIGDTVNLFTDMIDDIINYSWSDGTGLDNIDVYYTGAYYLTLKDKYGCEFTDSIYMEFIDTDTCDETSFKYPDFTAIDNLNLVKNARQIDDFIRLSNANINRLGAMWYNKLLPIEIGFVSEFSFRLSEGYNNPSSDKSQPGADGIAFLIQNSGPEAIGEDGGMIGYGGIENAIAIEFDLFSNDKNQIEDLNDPNGNHVAIMSNGPGIISSTHSKDNTLAINDDIMEIFGEGRVYYARVDYNITPNTLRVFLNDEESFTTPILEYSDKSIGEIITLQEESWAYLGITSSTGQCYQNHDILNWETCIFPTEAELDVEAEKEFNNTNLKYYFDANGNLVINYSLSEQGNTTLKLYDIMGREIYSETMGYKSIGENQARVKMNIPNGVYLYLIMTNDTAINGKIIK